MSVGALVLGACRRRPPRRTGTRTLRTAPPDSPRTWQVRRQRARRASSARWWRSSSSSSPLTSITQPARP